MTATGAHIEIIERAQDGSSDSVVVPNALFINGQEVLIPEGSEVIISPITDSDVVTATLTVFVASLSIKRVDPARP